MGTFKQIKIHWLAKMKKTTNKNGFIIPKIVNIKILIWVPSANKMFKFIVFIVRKISSFKNVTEKTGAVENKIHVIYCHQLFILLKLKIKDMFTQFPYCKRIHPNQRHQRKCLLPLIQKKVLGLSLRIFPDIYQFQLTSFPLAHPFHQILIVLKFRLCKTWLQGPQTKFSAKWPQLQTTEEK